MRGCEEEVKVDQAGKTQEDQHRPGRIGDMCIEYRGNLCIDFVVSSQGEVKFRSSGHLAP